MSDSPKTVYVRDPSAIGRLSIVYRWEFTRRHPYYLLRWQYAKAYWANPTACDRACMLAFMLLDQALSWSSVYMDPAVDLRQADTDEQFDLRCASPATPRALALRIATLPADLRRELARILNDELPCGPAETELKTDEELRDVLRMQAIKLLKHPYWDEKDYGIVVLARDAPLRGIQDDLASIHRKRNEDAREKRRVSNETLDEYLRVWDLREGFAEGRYNPRTGRRLRDIASDLGRPVPTVYDQYCSAFKHITGQFYTPETWIILFGSLNASRWASWRRSKTRSDSVTLVNETRLEGARPKDSDAGDAGIIGGAAAPQASNDLAELELLTDIRTLIDKGRTTDEIVAELEISPDLVQYFRKRAEDRL